MGRRLRQFNKAGGGGGGSGGGRVGFETEYSSLEDGGARARVIQQERRDGVRADTKGQRAPRHLDAAARVFQPTAVGGAGRSGGCDGDGDGRQWRPIGRRRRDALKKSQAPLRDTDRGR